MKYIANKILGQERNIYGSKMYILRVRHMYKTFDTNLQVAGSSERRLVRDLSKASTAGVETSAHELWRRSSDPINSHSKISSVRERRKSFRRGL